MNRPVSAGLAGVVLAFALSITACGNGSQTEPAPMASAQEFSRFAPRIVNGTLTSLYPTVGVLLDRSSFSTASLICSGTLIGCQTFLTAAHCVCNTTGADCQGAGAPKPSRFGVFLQHAGFFKIASIKVHPEYGNANDGTGDQAIITLATPVTGIAPTPIDTTAAPSAATSATIVGFGRSGGFNEDYGLKRTGLVSTVTCGAGISNTTSVCWDFKNPLGAPGTNSNTCNGDSGGPLFVNFGVGDRVTGVTSSGSNDACLPIDHSVDSNVFNYHTWIQAQAGTDLNNTSCGTFQQVGDPGTSVFAASGQLSVVSPEDLHVIPVASGITRVRIAMNALDDSFTNFDLYVKAGSAPTAINYDCRATGAGQYGFCEFFAPTPGSWYALVKQVQGSGQYQLTATTFGTDCSDPANAGAACDDSNPCTQNDTCQGGVCAGVPAAPLDTCKQPSFSGTGSLDVYDNASDQRDRLSWRWLQGSATDKAEFGDPLHTTDYALCVYDAVGGTPSLIMGKTIPAGGSCGTIPCWKDTRLGFRYADAKGRNGGITAITLQQGAAGFARVLVAAQGKNVQPPALPLSQDGAVRVQLRNGTTCWEAAYSSNLRNGAAEFKAFPD